MMTRPASLENSLALHRLNCVDRPSSFGDIQWRIQAEAREARATPSKKKKGKKKHVALVHDELKRDPYDDSDVEVDGRFKRAN